MTQRQKAQNDSIWSGRLSSFFSGGYRQLSMLLFWRLFFLSNVWLHFSSLMAEQEPAQVFTTFVVVDFVLLEIETAIFQSEQLLHTREEFMAVVRVWIFDKPIALIISLLVYNDVSDIDGSPAFFSNQNILSQHGFWYIAALSIAFLSLSFPLLLMQKQKSRVCYKLFLIGTLLVHKAVFFLMIPAYWSNGGASQFLYSFSISFIFPFGGSNLNNVHNGPLDYFSASSYAGIVTITAAIIALILCIGCIAICMQKHKKDKCVR